MVAQARQRLIDNLCGVRHKQQQVPGLTAQHCHQAGEQLITGLLAHRRAQAAISANCNPGHALAAVLPHNLGQCVNLFAAEASAILGVQALYACSLRENFEAAASHRIRHLAQLHAKAHIRPVGAKAPQRIRIGKARPRLGMQAPVANAANQRGHHCLNQIHHVVALYKRHFQIQLRELRLAVAALILITKTARNLKVALHPGDHQQLL